MSQEQSQELSWGLRIEHGNAEWLLGTVLLVGGGGWFPLEKPRSVPLIHSLLSILLLPPQLRVIPCLKFGSGLS